MLPRVRFWWMQGVCLVVCCAHSCSRGARRSVSGKQELVLSAPVSDEVLTDMVPPLRHRFRAHHTRVAAGHASSGFRRLGRAWCLWRTAAHMAFSLPVGTLGSAVGCVCVCACERVPF